MGEWKNVFLSEIALPTMGQSPSGDSVNEEGIGIPFLQGNADFGERYPNESCWCVKPKKLSHSLDVLVSVRAPVGQINIADKIYCVGRGLAAISFTGIDAAFGVYAFRNEVNQLHIRSQGTTFLAVNKADIDGMRLSIPKDEKEQRKIAEVLTTVDTAIEKTRALIEKYKNIKTGLMQDLLTNGIDEHGNIRSPKTHEYKDSPLGMIPVEWDCTDIRDISIKVGSGATPRGGQAVYTNDGIIFLRSQNITFDGITREDAAYITKQIHRQMRRSHVEKSDVLLNITGASIGRCCIYESDDKANVNQHVCIIRTPLGAEYARFIYRWLCSYGQSQIGLLMAGGNREGLNFEQIKSIKLPIIKDPAELTAINTALNRQDIKIQSEQAYQSKLLGIKQGLMQDLLTHRVPVNALL